MPAVIATWPRRLNQPVTQLASGLWTPAKRLLQKYSPPDVGYAAGDTGTRALQVQSGSIVFKTSCVTRDHLHAVCLPSTVAEMPPQHGGSGNAFVETWCPLTSYVCSTSLTQVTQMLVCWSGSMRPLRL